MDNKILTNKSLIILGIAEAISNIGNWITMMAVFSMLVFQGGGGVAESSGVFLAGLLPMLILSPLAGKLADSFNRVWLMIIGNVLSAIAVSGLIFADQIGLVYLCVAGEAVFISVIAPARQGLVPQLVPKNSLTRANALLQQLASVVKVFGPMVGAAVVGLLGSHRAVLLDVISFMLSAGLLLLLLTQLPAKAVKTTHSEQEEELSGAGPMPSRQNVWKALWSNLPLRSLFVAVFLAILAIMGLDVLSSVYTRDILRADEGFFGIQIGTVGLGSVLSGLYLLMRKDESNPLQDLAYGLVFLGVLIFSLVAGTFTTPKLARVIVIVGALIGGWGNGLVLVQGNTILQTYAPSAILGRLAGLFQSTMVAGQLLSLLLTPIIVPRYLSIGFYLACTGTVLMLLAMTILLSILKGRGRLNKRGYGVE